MWLLIHAGNPCWIHVDKKGPRYWWKISHKSTFLHHHLWDSLLQRSTLQECFFYRSMMILLFFGVCFHFLYSVRRLEYTLLYVTGYMWIDLIAKISEWTSWKTKNYFMCIFPLILLIDTGTSGYLHCYCNDYTDYSFNGQILEDTKISISANHNRTKCIFVYI